MEQGLYRSLDVDEALATFMVGDLPDPTRFLNAMLRTGREGDGYDDTAVAKGLR